MFKLRTAFLLTLGTVVFVLFTGGCSNLVTPGATSQPATSPTTVPAQPSPTTAQVQKPKDLTIAVSSLNPELDAGKACDMLSWSVMRLIDDPLLYLDWDMKTFKPWIALSWTRLNDNTWQLKLRKGVKFQDGEPLDASAVQFNLLRFQKVQLCMSFAFGETFLKDVQVLDPETVNLITTDPMWNVPEYLTMQDMLPPQATGSKDFGTHPIGSGPYSVVSYTPGQQLVLEANKSYWAYKPEFDHITVRVIPDDFTRVAALESGEVQLANNIPVEDATRLKSQGKVEISSVPSNRPISVGVNMAKDTPFSRDVRVRQAIAYAIDREGIAQTILGGMAQALPDYAIPPKLTYAVQMPAVNFDPAKARGLLSQAAYSSTTPCVFGGPAGRYLKDKEVAEAIVGQLANVGINCKLVTTEIGTYMTEARKGATSQYDLIFVSLSPADLGIDYQIANAFSANRFTQYKDPAMSQLVIDARRATDDSKRADIYRQIQQMAWDSYTMIIVYLQPEIHGAAPWLNFEARSDEWIFLRDRFRITQ